MKFKTDSLLLGTVLGVLAPVIIFFLFFLFRYHAITLMEFFKMVDMEDTFSQRISLCVIANLGIFFLFLRRDKYQTARGIILATFLYAGLVVYLKMIAP